MFGLHSVRLLSGAVDRNRNIKDQRTSEQKRSISCTTKDLFIKFPNDHDKCQNRLKESAMEPPQMSVCPDSAKPIGIYFISFVNCKQRYSHKFSFLHSTFPSQAVYFTKLGQEL